MRSRRQISSFVPTFIFFEALRFPPHLSRLSFYKVLFIDFLRIS